MIVADRLGVPLDQVRFEQSDTALIPRGGGAPAGRARCRSVAARSPARPTTWWRWPGRSPPDARGVGRRRRARGRPLPRRRGPDAERRLGRGRHPARTRTASRCAPTTTSAPDNATFPFGAHVSVVEVDTETGLVTPLRHTSPSTTAGASSTRSSLRASSTAASPRAFAGPVGGVLLRRRRPAGDRDLRRLRQPRGDRGAELRDGQHRDPDAPEPVGAKGIGESATVGSTPAVHNAVVDALSHLGVRHVDMPLTPQRVVEAVRRAGDGTLPDLWREPPAVFDDLKIRGGHRGGHEHLMSRREWDEAQLRRRLEVLSLPWSRCGGKDGTPSLRRTSSSDRAERVRAPRPTASVPSMTC